MSDNNQVPSSGLGGSSGSSNGILLATVLFLFLLVVLAAVFYLYTKTPLGTYAGHLLNSTHPRIANTAQNVSVQGDDGLDSTILRSLPVVVFGANKEFKDNRLECAVCLSEVNIGEKVRVLPKCCHRFHVDCIDTWFRSHSTCPLCRGPVGGTDDPVQPNNAESVQARISLNPVSREGYVGTTLVIDIPRQATEIGVPTSPVSPLPVTSAPFWSLKRILSRGKQLVGPSGSDRDGDVEQGNVVHTPKTPKSFGD